MALQWIAAVKADKNWAFTVEVIICSQAPGGGMIRTTAQGRTEDTAERRGRGHHET